MSPLGHSSRINIRGHAFKAGSCHRFARAHYRQTSSADEGHLGRNISRVGAGEGVDGSVVVNGVGRDVSPSRFQPPAMGQQLDRRQDSRSWRNPAPAFPRRSRSRQLQKAPGWLDQVSRLPEACIVKLVQRAPGRSWEQAVDRWIPDQRPLGHRATCIVGIAGNVRIGHARAARTWEIQWRKRWWGCPGPPGTAHPAFVPGCSVPCRARHLRRW